jgi:hypothetical protein
MAVLKLEYPPSTSLRRGGSDKNFEDKGWGLEQAGMDGWFREATLVNGFGSASLGE